MKNIFFYISKILKYILNPPAIKNSKINRTSKICPGCEVYNTSINKYSYIGSRCFIVNTSIGSFCSIADRCSIGGATHPVEYVSTSPIFCEGRNVLRKNFATLTKPITKNTVIGNDVWLGMGCYIKAGVTIGDGAVVGMGSVVTKNIPPYEIWAGNPAKKIRNRFTDKQIEKIKSIKWWDWEEQKIREKSTLFNNIDAFISNNYNGDKK